MTKKTDKPTALIRTVNDFMLLLKVAMAIVFVLYCLSGITLVKPDEVGMVLRMGRLAGLNRVDQVHQPGWVWAFPKPVDQVIKIPVKQIREVRISELAAVTKEKDIDYRSIDPVSEGYCISADENVFQAKILVKYQITDPVAAVFGFADGFAGIEALIRDFTVCEMVKAAGRFNIDGILSEDQKQLSLQVQESVQNRLNLIESGLTLLSLEFEEIAPPVFLQKDFEEVNTAYINRRNFINDAQSLSEEKLPGARARASEKVSEASAYEQTVLAEATAEAGKFNELLQAYLKNPEEISMNMIYKTRKALILGTQNMFVFPAEKDSAAAVRLYIGSPAKNEPLPAPMDLEDDEY